MAEEKTEKIIKDAIDKFESEILILQCCISQLKMELAIRGKK